jgi:dextranase
MFNNVNDFPTHATAPLEQDATYIEVWEPHTTLGDLGALATSAWMVRKDHPPILSAYLSCYVTGTERGATEAAMLVMATAFSHGASHLLLGEAGNALVDPYYPTNHVLSHDAVDVFARWYDFAVRYGDLLYGADRTDVTEFFAGGINEDVVLEAGGVAVSTKAQPGSLWLRVVRVPRGIVVHVINLAAQPEVAWDAAKQPTRTVEAATLSLSFVTSGARVLAASPEAPTLEPLAEIGGLEGRQDSSLSAGQSGVRFALPHLGAWTMIWIPAEELAAAPR